MGHALDIAMRTGLILGCLAYLVIGFPSYEPLPRITSNADAVFLNTLGVRAVDDGRYLVVSFPQTDCIYELSSECCGLILFAMYFIAILIVPNFSLKHRFVAILILPLIFLGNIVRIALGIIIGYFFTVDASVFFHDTFGQLLIFMWVIVCFMLWLKLTRNFPRETKEVKNV